jgi:acyl-CoA synthetase (AMP-forming)/AMP-acid ligase II
MQPSELGTIPRLVLEAATRYAGRTALEEGGRAWSFPELADAGLEAARAFIGTGLEPGDRVGIWAPNSAVWIIAAIGLHASGGVLVPLNTRFKGAEAGYILGKTRARFLLTVPDFLDTNYLDLLADQSLPDLEQRVLLEGDDPRGRSWQDFLAAGDGVSMKEARRRAESVSPDDLADIMFTSGTTGQPKGVMISHHQDLLSYERWSETVGLREGDRYLIVNPFFHAFGYKAGWMASIMCGCTILPHAVFDVPQVLERIALDRVSVLPGPPTLYESLLMHPERKKYDLSSLRLGMTGAAVIAPELVRRAYDELGFDTIVTGYGLTESCGVATQCATDTDPETVALTSGAPLRGIEVRAVDDAGRQLPPGEAGEIVIRGPNVMRGYLDDPEATAAAIDSEGWLHTGDIGFLGEDGNLRITDRKKDMFIMGGFNCYPAEIEQLMFEMPEIAQVAVIGMPDPRMGEVGMAFVVPEPGTRPTPESIIAWCREQMANYKVPRRVELVDALPTTASGKVQKFVLRERAVGGAPGGDRA